MGAIWGAFRKLAACALIAAICFGMMPYIFVNGVATGAFGLIAGVLAAIKGFAFLYALLIGIAATVGYIIEIGIPGVFISFCLAFTCGIMIYLACGEILPD